MNGAKFDQILNNCRFGIFIMGTTPKFRHYSLNQVKYQLMQSQFCETEVCICCVTWNDKTSENLNILIDWYNKNVKWKYMLICVYFRLMVC